MFGLFTPKCPLALTEKTWVEQRMHLLAARLGAERLRKARAITPTPEFFPDRYDADYPSARKCLDRMCGYMGVDPHAVTLAVLPDEAMPNAAGWYLMRSKGNICIANSQLADPMKLMATIAHEVGHEILLRGQHLTGTEIDHEQVTDLLPAFLGVGIFGANATLRESSWTGGGMSWWAVSMQGYLSMYVLGYALALFAFVRGERWPAWRKYLRLDVRRDFERGLRYLQKTGDSLFTPDTIGQPHPRPTVISAFDLLTDHSPTFRVAGLWQVLTGVRTDPRLLQPVIACLSHPDITVRTEAAWAVSVFGEASKVAVPQLVVLLGEGPYGAGSAAARALGLLRAEPERVVPELVYMVTDKHVPPTWELIDALAAYGRDALAALPRLLDLFVTAVGSNGDLATPLARALWAISPDPRRDVREHIGAGDPDLLRLALNELGTTPPDPTAPRYAPPPVQWGIPLPRPPR
jgi:hypothetical protein